MRRKTIIRQGFPIRKKADIIWAELAQFFFQTECMARIGSDDYGEPVILLRRLGNRQYVAVGDHIAEQFVIIGFGG